MNNDARKAKVQLVTGNATAKCGHSVTVFAGSQDRLYTLEYLAQFECCPQCSRS